MAGTMQTTPDAFARACATPGMRRRSRGRGRGLARGRGQGPIGQPFGIWNPFSVFTAPEPNFTWDQVKAAGFTDSDIDAYLRGTGLTRWALERNSTAQGVIAMLTEFKRSGTTTPTGVVATRVSEETPEEVAKRVFKEGIAKDVDPIKWAKYIKYGAVALGGLAVLRILRVI